MSFRGPAPLPAQRCRGSPELAGSLQVLTGVDAHRCRDRMGSPGTSGSWGSFCRGIEAVIST